MPQQDVKCVVVIVPNHWGKGKDLKTAQREVRRAGYKPPRVKKVNELKEIHYYFSCEPDKVSVESFLDCTLHWPDDAVVLRMEVRW